MLFEHGLFDTFDGAPEDALAELHGTMVDGRAVIPTCSSPSPSCPSSMGRPAEKPEHQLAAAVYAYAFLFPEGTGKAPGRFDPRLRIAADLYNWALTGGFASEDGAEVVPRGGDVHAAIRADRRGLRSEPPCALETASCMGSFRSRS